VMLRKINTGKAVKNLRNTFILSRLQNLINFN